MNYENIILLILLTIIIIFYGGKNHSTLVEYDNDYFKNYNNIIIFEKTLEKYYSKFNEINNNNNYVTINEISKLADSILPNYINNYLIKIEKYSYFDITNIINVNDKNNLMMIILNNNLNNLKLIVNKENNINYFYNLNKKTSITGIYDIYNDNDFEIFVTIFIVKKPYYWRN
jgi:hypothetical protein